MLTFIFVVLLLFLVPGPAVFLTISQTVRGGRKNGIITGIGIAVGDLLHTVAAVLGLSAILLTSSLAFQAVKYAGAAYLIYLGVRAILDRGKQGGAPVLPKGQTTSYFRQALFIELLNPKTALFFLAFLPQFVQQDGGAVPLQLLTLGLVFVLMSILYTTALVLLTGAVGRKISLPAGRTRWLGKLVGAVYIGLGLRLALETQR